MTSLFRFSYAFCFAVLLIPTSCKKETNFPADKIAVKWELVTNFTDSTDVFQAKFTLTNRGDQALSSDWNLFFNMAPRPILRNREPQAAILHHINGDWYKLTPEKDFVLAPGMSIEISYRGTEAVIKSTDRPLGLYFVFYDGDDRKQITEVTDYTFAPFAQANQVNRRKDDEQPNPTPDWLYAEYQKVSGVPDQKLSPVVPTPAKVKRGIGYFEINKATVISSDTTFSNEADFLKERLEEVIGSRLKTLTGSTVSSPAQSSIVFRADPSLTDSSPEAYRLVVTPQQIVISAAHGAGAFYGVQSLRMMFPVEDFKTRPAAVRIPAITIDDAPRFGFRSVQIDVSRNFQTKESIKRMLDLFALYKINRLLLYTTEDEGWRVAIDGLPELTETGAQRQHCESMQDAVLHPAYGSGPFARKDGTFGAGYYTREDFIEILRYAQDRHIKVIPELNFPGHARAAIKSMEARYQRLMGEGKKEAAEEFRLIDPDDKSVYLSAQGYKDNVVCVARESVFHFYEKVVDEFIRMYDEAGLTLDEFHTGGDEVPEGAWTQSPMATALLKQHPEVGDPKNLQMWFFKELVKRLKSRNLELHGWEEVALVKGEDGKYHPNNELAGENVVPYIWNNLFDPELSYRLANAGFKIVLCNVSNFYFDLAYDKDPNEPGLYWAGFVNERNAWSFAPFDLAKTTTHDAMGRPLNLVYASSGADKKEVVIERLKKEAQHNILGVEAQLWSETVKGREMMEYYVLPKLMGFSESSWAQPRIWETMDSKAQREQVMQEGWNAFATALGKRELPRLSYLNGGYNYRVPLPGAVIDKGLLKANAAYPGLEIRYTLDGTEPTSESLLYTHEVPVRTSVTLRCFDAAGKAGRSVKLNGPTVE
ncbi:MAG TPA: family 20 glycosylhydrolase [Chryseolinea sp.]|nr:family 20 glycosylhydrolase [Chryseolinea sp.]